LRQSKASGKFGVFGGELAEFADHVDEAFGYVIDFFFCVEAAESETKATVGGFF
jgi:hypothetical protein